MASGTERVRGVYRVVKTLYWKKVRVAERSTNAEDAVRTIRVTRASVFTRI